MYIYVYIYTIYTIYTRIIYIYIGWVEDDQKSNECWSKATTVTIRGATGMYAPIINGTCDVCIRCI